MYVHCVMIIGCCPGAGCLFTAHDAVIMCCCLRCCPLRPTLSPLVAWSARLQALENEAFRTLDSQKTLEENAIEDQSDELKQLGLDEREFAPVLQLYFNDDLTEA